MLDIELGPVSGLDLLPELRGSKGRAIPVIIFRAWRDTGWRREVQASLSKSRAALDSLVTTVHDRLTPRASPAPKENRMSTVRILHVDDEPDIREIVEMSLGLNADFEVRACANGPDAIAMAAEWSPALILLDVMMPGMDGPTTLAHLRKDPRTADIPVVFMTARAQAREVQNLVALGAQGVISKPFDPMTLAFSVRSHLQAIRLETLRTVFVRRAKGDAALLASCRSALGREAAPATVSRIREIAHGLAGAAGLFGFDQISTDAAVVEDYGGGAARRRPHPEGFDACARPPDGRHGGDWDAAQRRSAQSAYT